MEQYNGWTNYPTWAVKAWIDNDEASYRYWQRAAQEAGSVEALARVLQEEHELGAPETGGVYAELMDWALEFVNWEEVAKAIMEG